MKISICIPMYNEILTVGSTAEALKNEMERYCRESKNECEIIFSCDGSTDGSYDAVPIGIYGDKLFPVEIKRVRSEINQGKGAAVRRAVAASTGDIVMYTDCDLAYGTAPIPEAIKTLISEDCDILLGSRRIHPDGYKGYTAMRKAASKIYISILTAFAGFKLSDSQCGFKVFRGDCARSLFADCSCDGWAFDFEALALAEKKRCVLREFPVSIVNHRESRVNIVRDSLKMISEILRIKKRIKKYGD